MITNLVVKLSITLCSFILISFAIVGITNAAEVYVDYPKNNMIFYPGEPLSITLFASKQETVYIKVCNPNNRQIYSGEFDIAGGLDVRLVPFVFPISETSEFKYGAYTIEVYEQEFLSYVLVNSITIYFSPRFELKCWSEKTQVEIGDTTKVRLYLKNVCDRSTRNVTLLLIANTSGILFYGGRGDIWEPVVSWDLKELKPGDVVKLEVDVLVTAPIKQISFKARFYGDIGSGKRLLQEDIISIPIHRKHSPTQESPGFEIIPALAGLLIAVYASRR